MSKGALFTALEDVRAELLPLLERHEQPVQLSAATGIGWINSCLGALTGDPQYALLNAKRLCEMVIDVVVAAELLLQGDVGDETRRQLARSFASLNIPAVELNARRVAAGDFVPSKGLRPHPRARVMRANGAPVGTRRATSPSSSPSIRGVISRTGESARPLADAAPDAPHGARDRPLRDPARWLRARGTRLPESRRCLAPAHGRQREKT